MRHRQSCQLWLSARQVCLLAVTGSHADAGLQIFHGRLREGTPPHLPQERRRLQASAARLA